MVSIDIHTKDGKTYKFLEVNMQSIYDQITSIDVKIGDNSAYSYTYQYGETPIIKKRQNTKEGVIYIIGAYKNESQDLTFITEEGKIIRHEQDCGCDHVFHSDAEESEKGKFW